MTDDTPAPADAIDAVYARVSHAGRHLQRLAAIEKEYLTESPFRLEEIEPLEPTHVAVRPVADPPSLEAAFVFSDLLQQLRAALDNLIGAIRPGGPTGTSSFPVCQTEKAFKRRLSSDLNGVPSWARDEILKLQPFSEGEFTKELAMLHELARRDRHRAVLLQVGVPFVHGVTVQLQEDATTPVTFRGFDSIEWPLGVDAHPEITVVLCLNERGYGNAAIVPTSFHLLEVVRQVVDRIQSARPR